MKPDADGLLNNLAAYLLTTVAPLTGTDAGMKTVAVIAVLMSAVVEEFDRAAANRIEENKRLRDLFSRVIHVVADHDLEARMEEAVDTVDEDFRISALDKTNRGLRELFIDLHVHIEGLEGEDARRTEEAIWQEMAAMVKRREYDAWPPLK